MKHSKKLFIIPMFIALIFGCLSTTMYGSKSPFGGSADLSGLNLSEAETQEFQQFINALNNLPPEEQEFLAQLGQEMEKQMKDKGLDPSNPDDIFKWVDQQQPAQEKPTKPAVTPKPVPTKAPEIVPIAVKDTKSTKLMINEILKSLASLRQKAVTRESMQATLKRWSQELNDLTNFLHILTKEDLIIHLSSKDFTKLHQNLEKLNNALSKYEPTILAKEPVSDDEDDPYEVLAIPYNATPKQIKEAFNEIKELRSPDIIKDELELMGTDEKEKNKILKEARISFSFIKNAYESLKDPKTKAIIDRSLRDRIEADRRNEQSSLNAFKKLVNILSSTLYEQKVLHDITQLLEKYKPQELAQLKAQEEIEKKVFERSKQGTPRQTQTIVTGPINYEDQQFAPFYQQAAQDKAMRDYAYYPKPSFGPDRGSFGPGGSDFQGKQDGGKKDGTEGAKKEAAAEKGDKSKDTGGGDKADKSKGGSGGGSKSSGPDKSGAPDKKKEQVLDLIKDAEKILKSAKERNGIEELAPAAEAVTRKIKMDATDEEEAEAVEPEKVPVSFGEITKGLEAYLTTPTTRAATPHQAVNRIRAFVDQNKLKDLSEILAKLKKDAKGLDDDKIKALWGEKIQGPHSKMVNDWFEIFLMLDIPIRHNNGRPPIHGDKIKLHNITGQPESVGGKKKKAASAYDLSALKKLVFDIRNNFEELNNILKAPKVAKAEAAAPAPTEPADKKSTAAATSVAE